MNHLGVSSLRLLTATRLREAKEPIVVYLHRVPLAAVFPYEMYLRWQGILNLEN